MDLGFDDYFNVGGNGGCMQGGYTRGTYSPIRPIIHGREEYVEIHNFIRWRKLGFNDEGYEGSVIHISIILNKGISN